MDMNSAFLNLYIL